jgi:hypothetical protein
MRIARRPNNFAAAALVAKNPAAPASSAMAVPSVSLLTSVFWPAWEWAAVALCSHRE